MNLCDGWVFSGFQRYFCEVYSEILYLKDAMLSGKRGIFFNILENLYNLIVIENSPQKCYTCVTFGV